MTSPRRCAILLSASALFSCASVAPADPAATGVPRYPRRGPGCELAVYYTPVPGVPLWDDLGVAEANCNINDSPAECLRILRAEACHLGGDIIYNVPRKPLRPRDQVLQYRAQVAHSRPGSPKKAEEAELPPPATPEEAAGPVIPLPPPVETKVP